MSIRSCPSKSGLVWALISNTESTVGVLGFGLAGLWFSIDSTVGEQFTAGDIHRITEPLYNGHFEN